MWYFSLPPHKFWNVKLLQNKKISIFCLKLFVLGVVMLRVENDVYTSYSLMWENIYAICLLKVDLLILRIQKYTYRDMYICKFGIIVHPKTLSAKSFLSFIVFLLTISTQMVVHKKVFNSFHKNKLFSKIAFTKLNIISYFHFNLKYALILNMTVQVSVS